MVAGSGSGCQIRRVHRTEPCHRTAVRSSGDLSQPARNSGLRRGDRLGEAGQLQRDLTLARRGSAASTGRDDIPNLQTAKVVTGEAVPPGLGHLQLDVTARPRSDRQQDRAAVADASGQLPRQLRLDDASPSRPSTTTSNPSIRAERTATTSDLRSGTSASRSRSTPSSAAATAASSGKPVIAAHEPP